MRAKKNLIKPIKVQNDATPGEQSDEDLEAQQMNGRQKLNKQNNSSKKPPLNSSGKKTNKQGQSNQQYDEESQASIKHESSQYQRVHNYRGGENSDIENSRS